MVIRFKSPIVVEPYNMKWFDVELPNPRPHEAIFQIKACLICGSDLHTYKGLHPFAPLPACCGHEVAAKVIEVGCQVTALEVGDRVYVAGAGASPIPCGQCYYCVAGLNKKCRNPHTPVIFQVNTKQVTRFPSGYGKYTINHESRAFKIPKNVSYYEAAVTTDTAYVIGVIQRSKATIGDTGVILGAGPIGLRTLEIARLAGVSQIIVSEPVDYRRRCAKELGADEVINPMKGDPVKSVMDLTDGEGVNFVYDTAGNPVATRQGLNMLKTQRGGQGTIYLMGLYEQPELSVHLSSLMYKAGKVVAEWGVSLNTRKNIVHALKLMQQRKLHIGEWITHKLPEHEAPQALTMLIEKKSNAIGVEIVH